MLKSILAPIALLILITTSTAVAQSPPEEKRLKASDFFERIPPAEPLSPREIAEKVMPSVVLLMMQDQNGQPLAMASGFVVSDGIVATNFHAI